MARPGAVIENPVIGDRITFLRTTAETAGELLEFDIFARAGAQGPPEHIHPHSTERFEVLRGTEAVVHLGAIPAPGLTTPETTFRENISSTYNVFTAATTLGLERVVWASSETVLGLPFDQPPAAGDLRALTR